MSRNITWFKQSCSALHGSLAGKPNGGPSCEKGDSYIDLPTLQ